MIIPVDGEKACDKVQHPFMIKILSKVGVEEAYLNIMMTVYKNPLPASYSTGKKYKSSP